jgi:hypothetical protein
MCKVLEHDISNSATSQTAPTTTSNLHRTPDAMEISWNLELGCHWQSITVAMAVFGMLGPLRIHGR